MEIFACLSPGWFSSIECNSKSLSWKERKAHETRKGLQRTLASCAQTCHAFSDLALAELWRVLDHPDVLLGVLPWGKENGGLCYGILVRMNVFLWVDLLFVDFGNVTQDPDPSLDNRA